MAENLTTELGHIIPDVYFDKVNLHSEGETLIVKINAHLKDFVEEDVVSSWFADEDFAKYFKVDMYYSTDREVTQHIIEYSLHSSRAGEIDMDWKSSITKKAEKEKTFVKNGTANFVKSDYISVSDSGNEIIDIPLVPQKIKLDQVPGHLTVFFGPRLNLASLATNMDLPAPKWPQKSFIYSHKIFAFTIFDNGQTVSTQKQFVTKDDVDKSGDLATAWSGPVHSIPGYEFADPAGGYKYVPLAFMKGAKHPGYDVPHDFLELIDVENNIVQDFRSVTRLEQTQLDLTQLENQLMPALQIVEKYAKTTEGNKMVDKKPRYFSELLVSRNDENQASFVFMFDQRQYLKNNSTYKALFALSQFSDGVAVEDILLENSRISSMQIYRTRVDEKAPDDDNGPTLLVATGQSPAKIGVDFVASPPDVGGYMFTELTDNMNLSKGIRVFTILDHEMKKLNAGKYSYRVALEVTDPTIPHIKNELKKLYAAQATFEKYYQKSLGYATAQAFETAPQAETTFETKTGMPLKKSFPFYDYITEKFRPEFRNSVTNADWLTPIDTLKQVLFAIYGSNFNLGTVGNPYGGSGLTGWGKMVSPTTGSPDGIKAIMETMDKFVVALEKLVSVTKAASPADKTSSNKTKATKALRAEYTFSESFDASESSAVGYHYMSLPELNASRMFGLKEYNPSWVDTRVNLEVDKYFGLGQAAKEEVWDWGDRLQNSDYKGIVDGVNIQKYSYVSPSKIDTLALGSTEQLEKGGIYNKAKHQKLLLDIIQYKKTGTPATFDFKAHPGEASKEKNKDWHAMRSGLIDLMSEENCVMISKEGFSEGAFSFKSFKSIFKSFGLPNFFGKKDNKTPPLDSTKKEESIPYTVPSDQEDYNPNSLFLHLVVKSILEKEGMSISSIKNLYYAAAKTNEDFFAYDYQAAYFKYFGEMLKKYGSKMKAMKMAKKKVFTDLPNQLKALIVNSETIYPKYAQNVDPKDPMKDPKSFMAIWLNFKNLMKIEYFQGFVTDKTNETNFLGLPAWTTLPADYKNLGSSEKPFLLCRLTRHADQQFGIVESPLLDLPVFDQYFLINAADTSTIAAGLLPEVKLGINQISATGAGGMGPAAPVGGTPAGMTPAELGFGGAAGAVNMGGLAMNQLNSLAKAADAGTKKKTKEAALGLGGAAGAAAAGGGGGGPGDVVGPAGGGGGMPPALAPKPKKKPKKKTPRKKTPRKKAPKKKKKIVIGGTGFGGGGNMGGGGMGGGGIY